MIVPSPWRLHLFGFVARCGWYNVDWLGGWYNVDLIREGDPRCGWYNVDWLRGSGRLLVRRLHLFGFVAKNVMLISGTHLIHVGNATKKSFR